MWSCIANVHSQTKAAWSKWKLSNRILKIYQWTIANYVNIVCKYGTNLLCDQQGRIYTIRCYYGKLLLKYNILLYTSGNLNSKYSIKYGIKRFYIREPIILWQICSSELIRHIQKIRKRLIRPIECDNCRIKMYAYTSVPHEWWSFA